MKPVTQRFSDATLTPGPQSPIVLDYLPTAHTTVALWLAEGASITAAIEVTMDDINDPEAIVRWFPLAEAPETTGYTNFWEPWRFIRINISVLVGSAEFKIAQSTTPTVR